MTDTAMADHQIKYMAERFLGWKLPKSWHPDGGISFEPEFNAEYNAKHGLSLQWREPTGTNLFDYTQAVAMIYHMVEGLPEFFLEWDGPLTTEEEAKIDEAWETHKAAAVIARHIPRGGDGLVAELERQQGLAKAYRRAQLTAEQKLFREQANSAGWKKRSEYQATRITQLKTQCERMAEALERSRQGWSNVLELGLLPVQHQSTALGLQEAATQALTEWKDRA